VDADLSTEVTVDRVAWFGLDDAAARIVTAQRAFLTRLAGHLAAES
jgi:predicted NUDIX family NTP pyrophosphohydrolase